MSIYSDWGFSRPPFDPTPLPANEEGRQLLIGRDHQMDQIARRLHSGGSWTTIEGKNGVGKTSIVNVTIFREMGKFIAGDIHELLIPCHKSFQIKPDTNSDDFIFIVMAEVAQTLLSLADNYDGKLRIRGNSGIDKWLNAETRRSIGLGLSIAGFGGSITAGANSNTSQGFTRSGFILSISNWLREIFNEENPGAMVCIIDNLEVMETSGKARTVLEQLRDSINIPGLRWVLCGANGIIHGCLSSPRLEGYISSPLEIKEIDKRYVSKIIEARISVFSSFPDTTQLPFSIDSFVKLYEIFRGSMRNSLGYTHRYCQHIADRSFPETTQDKNWEFEDWLNEESIKVYSAIKDKITRTGWSVFEKAVRLGGSFSPGDFAEFGFDSQNNLRQYIKTIEDFGLMQSSRDDDDNRRKTIVISSKGWLVSYAHEGKRVV